MEESIFLTIKTLLGFVKDYHAFDEEILVAINTNIMALNQMGIGVDNFEVTGEDETWDQFLKRRKDLRAVKTLLHLRVRLMFDPPSSNLVCEMIEKQIQEIEARLSYIVDPGPNFEYYKNK